MASEDRFDGVSMEGAPFFAAVLAAERKGCAWIACEGARAAEDFAGELALWAPATRLLQPRLSFSPDILPDPETEASRLETLGLLATPDFHGPIVLANDQLAETVPDPSCLRANTLPLACGGRMKLEDLTESLVRAGYEKTYLAAARGQFAVRGGIVDIYSKQASSPIRVELDDERIASLRAYDADSQLSTREVPACDILLEPGGGTECPLGDLVQTTGWLASVNVSDPLLEGVQILDLGEGAPGIFPAPFGELAAGDLVLDEARARVFFDQLEEWRSDGWQVVLAAGSEGERTRFREFAAEHHHDVSWLDFLSLPLSRSFVYPSARLAVLADASLFGRASALRASRAVGRAMRVSAARAATDFSDFEEGDHVVHLEHGIGIFLGLGPAPGNPGEEVLVLGYAEDSRLYVPLDQAWQVSRYAGLGKSRPGLHRLGSPAWDKARERATRSVFDYAARMLRVQAERETLEGIPHPQDTHWQSEFEDAFPHTPTSDQGRAISETKHDMESLRPMDRLVCGDVGFGKTEVAIRAAFKSVMGGRQAAFLAPTTVLARQHFHTLRERMSDYPVTIELLSRYRTQAEQRRVVEGLASGSVDIVVGTHRLISPDVVFHKLGLVIVDEEQRFGVRQKDLLKERFRQIDVLTLSATPIPRTLYMALSGARDMSLIETPPPNRQPVETVVCAYDERVWRDAILSERERGGQVYFLHNRVRTIEKVASRVRELCPGARVVVGHGQMTEGELEPVMEAFVSGRADVLVSTTIVESGLDIPNANTIVIDRADLYGLADLYQLRGRVGRAAAKAYAYLMLPRDLMGAARKRVSAIKQYSELGSGFKIAMRDLELRGAGNLLGTAQSGNIVAVGFDLYCRLLRRAVDALSGGTRFSPKECTVRLDFVDKHAIPGEGRVSACLPADYVADARTRIACYRQLAEADTAGGLDRLASEWRDRFGPPPPPAECALLLARLAVDGISAGLTSIEVRDSRVLLTKGRAGLVQEGGRFPRLTEKEPTSRLRELLAFVQGLSGK
jgi:transcription-repair coupling factor (superfamily II helicase)